LILDVCNSLIDWKTRTFCFRNFKIVDNKKIKAVDGIKLPVGKFQDTDERVAAMELILHYVCMLMELGEDPGHSIEFSNILTVSQLLLLGKDLGIKLEKISRAAVEKLRKKLEKTRSVGEERKNEVERVVKKAPENILFQAMNRPIVFRGKFEKFTEYILGFKNYSKAFNFNGEDTVCLWQSFSQGPALEWLESFKETSVWKISPTYEALKSKMSQHFEYGKTEMGSVMELEAVRMNSSLQEYIARFRSLRRSANVTEPTAVLWFRRNLHKLLAKEIRNYVARDLESLIR
jgi:Retrotransposon gag protein